MICCFVIACVALFMSSNSVVHTVIEVVSQSIYFIVSGEYNLLEFFGVIAYTVFMTFNSEVQTIL